MKPYDPQFSTMDYHLSHIRKPDFNNLLKVLQRKVPDRPTLFEFFLNGDLYVKLADTSRYSEEDLLSQTNDIVNAFHAAGYDYVNMLGSEFEFKTISREQKATVSLNSQAVIFDRESFEKYEWPDPDLCDYSGLEKIAPCLPEGMKAIVFGMNGILENVIGLVGFDALCYMIADDPGLVQDIFDAVGSRFVRYYEICASYDAVGACISNDDWGFNTQTTLSVKDMRRFVIPWHKKIAASVHKAGKPVILHSCGMLDEVMDDIIDEIGYDAKHSYEDNIRPVEEAYEKYAHRIAILGGIDVDFLCRSTPETIYNRSQAMLERTMSRGGYALGSGNSIPEYVPEASYLTMVAAAK